MKYQSAGTEENQDDSRMPRLNQEPDYVESGGNVELLAWSAEDGRRYWTKLVHGAKS